MPEERSPLAADLRTRLLAFNLAPVGYIHESWYDALPRGGIVRDLSSTPWLRRAVSETIMREFGLDKAFVPVCETPRARLALLDRPLFESLMLYVGAALRGREFSAILDGRRVAYLRREIGTGPFEFATRRAALAGPLPDFAWDPAGGVPRDQLIRIGAAYALSREATEAAGYLRRVRLMLPRSAAEMLGQDLAQAEAHEGEGLPGLVRRVIKEFTPQWLPFFA